MQTRKINITFEIEDNDAIEYAFEKEIRGYFESETTKITDYQVLPNTKVLYEKDENFRKLCSKYKKMKKDRKDYIFKHNRKFK